MECARSEGICADGYGHMRAYDRDELIEYYTYNPDWCIERGFPSLELLRREFSDIEDRGVFVGRFFAGEELSGLQTYIFHACRGTVRIAMDYDNAVIPMLYFANGCDMTVECVQANSPAIRVPLYVGAGCRVEANASEGCRFRKFRIASLRR